MIYLGQKLFFAELIFDDQILYANMENVNGVYKAHVFGLEQEPCELREVVILDEVGLPLYMIEIKDTRLRNGDFLELKVLL